MPRVPTPGWRAEHPRRVERIRDPVCAGDQLEVGPRALEALRQLDEAAVRDAGAVFGFERRDVRQ
ncbi:MAG TPA: hypothetical protein VIF36_04170 [Gaiellaceae bacterium]